MKSISVIVPVYYGEKYIRNMIRQVEVSRGYLDEEDYVEILFVNDAEDAPISEEWSAKTVQVFVINTDRNVGIQGARLKGLKNCRGEYVLFLDQDDLIRPRYFSSQLSAIGENDAVICRAIHAGKMWYTGENIFEKAVSKEYMLGMRWGWNPIASPGQALLRKCAIPDIWTENLLKNRGGDDWLLWLSMLSRKCSFSLNQEVLYEHIVHEQNFSNHIVEMLQSEQEVVRIVQEQRWFADSDLLLLLDGLFKRNVMRVREQASLKEKWEVLDQWVKMKENHIKLSDHLIRSGVRTAAVYGCTILGQLLIDELKEDIDIKYYIDKNADRIKKNIPVYTLQDKLPEVDCVIITLIDEAEKAEQEVCRLLHGQTLVMKDWVMKYRQ